MASEPDLRDDVPTAPEPIPVARIKRARMGRRVVITLVVLLVLAGMLRLFGVWSATQGASTAGWNLELKYARVTRPGLTTPWRLTIHHEGGFLDKVDVEVDRSYIETFKIDQIHPDPSESTATPDSLLWTFDAPPGDTLTISLIAHIDPSADWGRRRGSAAVIVDNQPVVGMNFTTFVMP
jgi:hypothetical protein